MGVFYSLQLKPLSELLRQFSHAKSVINDINAAFFQLAGNYVSK